MNTTSATIYTNIFFFKKWLDTVYCTVVPLYLQPVFTFENEAVNLMYLKTFEVEIW